MQLDASSPVGIAGSRADRDSKLLHKHSSSVSSLLLFSLLLPPSSICGTAVLEKPLEKKAGRNYGPPGSRRLIYFIDDMNMPEVDAYGTVQPHTLIRQHMDYNHW